MQRTQDLVAQFVSVTGADESTAKYYLEANGYNLEKATVLFFDSGGVAVAASSESNTTKMEEEGTGATAKNVGLEFDAQAYGELLQRSFAHLCDAPHVFSDIAFILNGEKVLAHRIIVSAWSPVLRDMLHSNPDKRELAFPFPCSDASVAIFQQVLRYMYTGCTALTKEIAVPLLEMAHHLQVDSLKNKVSEFIFVCEEKKDIGALLELSRQYASKHLEQRCAGYLADRFDDCLKNESLNSLPLSTWKELLQRDDIKVSNEEDVYTAVIKYAGLNPVTKVDTLKTLLPLVRFVLLPNRFLVEEIDLNPEMKELGFVHELVHEAYRQKLYQQVGGGALPTRRSGGTGRGGTQSTVRSWSSTLISDGIEVLEKGKSVRHTGAGKGTTQSWQSACIDTWISSGVHLFTFNITKNLSSWIFIGVASRAWSGYKDSEDGYCGHYYDSWSFGSHAGWGRAHGNKNSGYGRSFSTGDVVQMTVDMDNKTISYAINGSDQGVCHRKISADEVCPVVTLYKQGDQITLI